MSKSPLTPGDERNPGLLRLQTPILCSCNRDGAQNHLLNLAKRNTKRSTHEFCTRRCAG